MPIPIFGNRSAPMSWKGKDSFTYPYPPGLALKPGTLFHDELRNKILERATFSANKMSQRHDSWQKMDESVTAYSWIDDEEAKVQQKDARKPVSIVFPYSYAILETLMSYMVSAFFPEPMFRYEGVGPEDLLGSMLMELIIGLHVNKTKVSLGLHTMYRDSFIYGIGAGVPGWEVRRGSKLIVPETAGIASGLSGMAGRELLTDQILFEGNNFRNISPYRTLIDPNVSIDRFQEGEFFGWVERTNYVNLLTREGQEDDRFNTKYLSLMNSRVSSVYKESQTRGLSSGEGASTNLDDQNVVDPIDVVVLYVNLIPADWKLSNVDVPQKWLFELAGDEVILSARPADFNHNMYPAVAIAPDSDGYSTTPLSRLEVLGGIQHLLNFTMNSHVTNVRKAINDMFIVDPSMVNMGDVYDPLPGKLIRLRKKGFGRGVDNVLKQLAVTDVTRGNVADAGMLISMMEKVGGADSSMMGMQRSGGPDRLTSAEFQGTRSGAMSRLERVAKMIGVQGMQDLGMFFASHTQQLLTLDTYVKIVGDHEKDLKEIFGNRIQEGRLNVKPNELLINYDLIVRDGSVPGGNFNPQFLQLYDMLAKNPELGAQFDMVRIFKYLAKSMGAKNVNDFVKQGGNVNPQVMPDEEVAKNVQAGNLIPTGGQG